MTRPEIPLFDFIFQRIGCLLPLLPGEFLGYGFQRQNLLTQEDFHPVELLLKLRFG